MAEALNIIPDGTSDFSGGMNGALSANNIQPNQVALSINTSCQKTILTPRWGIVEDVLDWTNTGNYRRYTGLIVPFQTIFEQGKFQAFRKYGIGPDKYNIYVVSGFIFLINLGTMEVSVLNPSDCLNVNADRINIENAGRFLVIHDFPNLPFILEGIQIRRSRPNAPYYEVPISVMGAYNQNRLCIANAGIDWTAGDPSGSLAAPNAPVTFMEVEQASTGFTGDIYQVPTANRNNDVITAMGFLQVLDKSTELGPLLVATNSAIYSYRTDLPRIQWQGGTSNFVFGSVFLYSDGIVGPRAMVNVGSDIVFLANDGQIHTTNMARNAQNTWSNSPISREVEQFLIYNDDDLQQYGVCTHFANKIFTTCNPYRVDCYSAEGNIQTDYVQGGIVVLELDNTSVLSNKAPPVWGGMWTGVQFTDFADNNGFLYISGKLDGKNGMFHFDPDKTWDVIDGKVRLVESWVDTKEYNNQTSVYQPVVSNQTHNKALHSLDLGLRELVGKVELNVSYKTSTVKNYVPYRDITFNAPYDQCDGIPLYANGLTAQGIRDLNLGGVDELLCNIAEDYPMYVYKGIQFRIKLTGKYWELNYTKVKGILLNETPVNPYCEKSDGVPIPMNCFNPWHIPSNC